MVGWVGELAQVMLAALQQFLCGLVGVAGNDGGYAMLVVAALLLLLIILQLQLTLKSLLVVFLEVVEIVVMMVVMLSCKNSSSLFISLICVSLILNESCFYLPSLLLLSLMVAFCFRVSFVRERTIWLQCKDGFCA